MVPSESRTAAQAIDAVTLPHHSAVALAASVRDLGSPYEATEDFLLSLHPVLATLPAGMLRSIFAFRNDPAAHGALLLKNFPVDEDLPATPVDGRRSRDKKSFIGESCLLGIAQLLGHPLGYQDEKAGEIIHNLCPLPTEASATSSESSQIGLGFHTDFNFDKERPEQPFNIVNPDYIVLICLRADRHGEARTLYSDARDICRNLTTEELAVLRKPVFQFAASYSFTGKCGADRIWSVPSAVITGPDRYPEVSIDLLCGIRAITAEASAVLEKLRGICPAVARGVTLRPGDILLIDNRKGAHSRSPFRAYFDGQDRWVQRVYVRRSLWELRNDSNASLRVF